MVKKKYLFFSKKKKKLTDPRLLNGSVVQIYNNKKVGCWMISQLVNYYELLVAKITTQMYNM